MPRFDVNLMHGLGMQAVISRKAAEADYSNSQRAALQRSLSRRSAPRLAVARPVALQRGEDRPWELVVAVEFTSQESAARFEK
jgi:hypothetical protein